MDSFKSERNGIEERATPPPLSLPYPPQIPCNRGVLTTAADAQPSFAAATAADAVSPLLSLPPHHRCRFHIATASVTNPGLLRRPHHHLYIAIAAAVTSPPPDPPSHRGCRQRAKLALPLPPHCFRHCHLLLMPTPILVRSTTLSVASVKSLLPQPPHCRITAASPPPHCRLTAASPPPHRGLISAVLLLLPPARQVAPPLSPCRHYHCRLTAAVIAIFPPPPSSSRVRASALDVASVLPLLLLAPHRRHLSVSSLLPLEL